MDWTRSAGEGLRTAGRRGFAGAGRLLILLLLGVASAACGDDGSSGRVDAAAPDGAARLDARTADGPSMDSAADGRPGADAASDAAAADGGARRDAVVPGTCALDDPAELFRDPNGAGLELAAAGGSTGFLVAWTAFVDGGQDLFAKRVSVTGEPGSEQRVAGDRGLARHPAVARADTGWLVAWSESATGALNDFEVVTRRLGAEGMPAASPTAVTDNTLEDREPTLLRVGDGVLAAWIEQDAGAGTPPRLVGQRLGSAGEAVGAARSLAPDGAIASAPRLAGRPDGAAVLWLDRMSDRREVRIRRLSPTGSPDGEARPISTQGKVFAELDATEGGQGGLAVFDVSTSAARRDVQARPYREDAVPTGSERLLSGGSLAGRSPSVAPLAGGFAVLWRTSAELRRQLRFALLDTDAHVLHEQSLATLRARSGALRIRASTDGRLLAAWVDRETDGATVLWAARIRCGR